MEQLPYFFEEDLPDNTTEFELSPATSRHLIQVLRLKEGAHFLLTNGKGIETEVKLVKADKKIAKVAFVSRTDHLSPESEVAIAISLLKNENRFEWFLEKVTELGVQKIFPLICERTEKKTLRLDRMRNIMVSAMLQSRQVFLPQLDAPIKLDLLYGEDHYQQKFIAHCIEDSDKGNLSKNKEDSLSKIILVGPEGDFTPKELEKALKEGYLPVTLGDTRLRTETAGITAAVLLLR